MSADTKVDGNLAAQTAEDFAKLYEENQQLILKNAELEESLEMYKAKTESLEEQMGDLRRANNELRQKLESMHTAPPNKLEPHSPIIRGYSDGDILESSDSPLLGKKKKPLPPLPPGGSPRDSLGSPRELYHTLPSSPSSPAAPSGWSAGSISRRSDTIVGKTTRSSLIVKENLQIPATQTPSTPSPLAQNATSADIERTSEIREERANTSPIPAASPNMVPTLNRSMTSLALAEAEEADDVEEDNPDLVLATNDETGKVMVKGGTLDKLVERMSYEKSPDAEYVAAFLLTYRSFTTQAELLDKLIQRYNIQPPEGSSAEEEQTFINKKRKIVRLRVGNALKMWVDKHLHDFANDTELVQKLSNFVDTQLLVDIEAQGRIIKKLLFNERIAPTLSWSEEAPALISPKPKDTFKEFDALEVARQITLIEQELYRSIETKECLNQSWNKPDKEEKSPHIVAMIKRFNLVSVWVATEIVKTEKLDARVSVMKKFITIAEKCRELGNFNAIMEILAGLQNSAIYRLKKTWEKVFHKSNYEETYNSLMSLMNNKGNFKDYRAALHKCHPPCIPYLGVYLTDLTFIEDGMKNNMNGRDDLINFEKRRKLSTVIHEIQQYQQTPYHLLVEDTIRSYLLNIEGLTEKALYKYSLICEPREGKVSQENFKKEFSLPSFLSSFNK